MGQGGRPNGLNLGIWSRIFYCGSLEECQRQELAILADEFIVEELCPTGSEHVPAYLYGELSLLLDDDSHAPVARNSIDSCRKKRKSSRPKSTICWIAESSALRYLLRLREHCAFGNRMTRCNCVRTGVGLTASWYYKAAACKMYKTFLLDSEASDTLHC